jgi:hypothetical protein
MWGATAGRAVVGFQTRRLAPRKARDSARGARAPHGYDKTPLYVSRAAATSAATASMLNGFCRKRTRPLLASARTAASSV